MDSLTRAKIAQVCGGNVPIPPSSASLSASPISGPAPLTVYFQGSGSALDQGAFINFGDGTNSGNGIVNVNHAYNYPGTYTATLHKNGAKGEIVARATITVTGGTVGGITVTAPNGGKSYCVGDTIDIKWAHPSNMSSVTLQLFTPGVGLNGGTIGSYSTQGTGVGGIQWQLKQAGRYTVAPGPHKISVHGNSGGVGMSDESDAWFTVKQCDQPGSPISVTAPNGGEQWEIGQLNTITWNPYNPTGTNASNQVIVYLEKCAVDGGCETVGRVIEAGKASLHTYFNINDYQTFAKPGIYYVRAVNNVTGAWDRSDKPFTLLPRRADLKVNGSDGPITLTDNQKITVTWSVSDADKCSLHSVRESYGANDAAIHDLPPTGNRELYAYVNSYSSNFIWLNCSKGGSAYAAEDKVYVNIGNAPASLQVKSPNGGEQLDPKKEMMITYLPSGLKSVSVALYKNDQWKTWIQKDAVMLPDFNSPVGPTLVPSEWIQGLGEGDNAGAIWKVYVTGQKVDGSGYVDDKSDAAFSFVTSPTVSRGVHVVGVYEGTYPSGVFHSSNNHPEGTVNVAITGFATPPSVLVLSSYEPMHWVINNPSGAAFEKVVTLGYHDQRVSGLPTGTVVESHTVAKDGNYAWSCAYANYETDGGCSYNSLKNWLSARGMPVTTFTGSYAGKAFTVSLGGATSTPTIFAAKNSSFGNQTHLAGTNNAKIGSFTLSGTGITLQRIVIEHSAEAVAAFRSLKLVDAVTGAQIGNVIATPSGANTFAFGTTTLLSGTKTFDVYANIISSATPRTHIVSVDASTGGIITSTGASVNIGADVGLQTINVLGSGGGTLTVTRDVGTPINSNVIAGATGVLVGRFDFMAQNSAYTVQELKVKIPSDASTSVSSVTLKYKNSAGVVQTISQALALPSGTQTHAIATFTGLSMYVPLNDSRDIDVYVDVPTMSNGTKSGAAISVGLDADEGFKAYDSAGAIDTSLAASDLFSNSSPGYGTMYVRKTKPVLAIVALDSTTLVVGSNQVLGRFSVAADAAGMVDWGSVIFTVDKTAAITLDSFTMWSGSNQIAGSFIGAASCLNQTTCFLHFRPTTVETISAGVSKTYELRGTVGSITMGGNSVTVSIANPQLSASATTNFAAVAGTQGVSTAPSFVWSDWSDISDHSSNPTGASTSDWMGEYLVKTLPLIIGNKFVAFDTLSPLPGTQSCTFNGQTVAHGASVIAHQSATVPFGQTCVSQSRACTNGVLSGTYTNSSCSVTPALAPTGTNVSLGTWVGVGAQVTQSGTTATLTESTTNAQHFIHSYITVPAASTWKFSFDARATAADRIVRMLVMNTDNPSGNHIAMQCTLTGVGGVKNKWGTASASGIEASGTQTGDGWYTCALSGTLSSASISKLRLVILSENGALKTYQGDGESKIELRNLKLESFSSSSASAERNLASALAGLESALQSLLQLLR